ncbi:MAG: hypothetical protein PHY02_06280 [Phycisphaerae bacterium]|nr:hypothetical protein [Phycisphaerae bacterium]
MGLQDMNTSDGRVMFDEATGMLQLRGGICEVCPEGTTPNQIAFDMAGVLHCPNLGQCCPVDGVGVSDTRMKFIDQGIGWDISCKLDMGRIIQQEGPGGGSFHRELGVILPCWFSFIKFANFGSFEFYNLDGCEGGVKDICDLNVLGCHALAIDQYEGIVDIQVELGYKGRSDPYNNCGYIHLFYNHSAWGYPNGECFPYNLTIENQATCDDSGLWNNQCIGNGHVILQKM